MAVHEASVSLGGRQRNRYRSLGSSEKGPMGLQKQQLEALRECSIDLAVEVLLGCWMAIPPG